MSENRFLIDIIPGWKGKNIRARMIIGQKVYDVFDHKAWRLDILYPVIRTFNFVNETERTYRKNLLSTEEIIGELLIDIKNRFPEYQKKMNNYLRPTWAQFNYERNY